MALKNCTNWNALIGAIVEIRLQGDTVRTGVVDDAMDDPSILWLASDGNHRRTIYEAALGYQVWVEPQELIGTSAYRMTASRLFPDEPSDP